MKKIESRHQRLIRIIEEFPESRLHWIESVVDILNCPQRCTFHKQNLMKEDWALSFGDALMIHHAFSNEPFTKDKFEYALVSTAKLVGVEADFAPRGNRGHDVKIGSTKYSLKTQADKLIKNNFIWISKYMELGKGEWGDNPEHLKTLLYSFPDHLKGSDRILILRCLQKAPNWKYELIEIPKKLLEKSEFGELKMMEESKQMPKPGICNVTGENNTLDFQLYFDGGTERKLQIKALRKSLCNIIGEWEFDPNP
ncbi:MAG: hypothetical protein ABIN36_16635 [Ferruginibacter sp.]